MGVKMYFIQYIHTCDRYTNLDIQNIGISGVLYFPVETLQEEYIEASIENTWIKYYYKGSF